MLASLAAYLHIWLIEIDFCVENKSLLHTYRRVGHTAKSRTVPTVRGGMRQTNELAMTAAAAFAQEQRNCEQRTGNWELQIGKKAGGNKELGKGKAKRERKEGKGKGEQAIG